MNEASSAANWHTIMDIARLIKCCHVNRESLFLATEVQDEKGKNIHRTSAEKSCK